MRERTPTADPQAGLTVADLAARLRVSPDKVRAWLRSGELVGVNTTASLCGRPRFVITPDALGAFLARRSAATARPARRKRKRTGEVDYYPDTPAQAEGVAK